MISVTQNGGASVDVRYVLFYNRTVILIVIKRRRAQQGES